MLSLTFCQGNKDEASGWEYIAVLDSLYCGQRVEFSWLLGLCIDSKLAMVKTHNEVMLLLLRGQDLGLRS